MRAVAVAMTRPRIVSTSAVDRHAPAGSGCWYRIAAGLQASSAFLRWRRRGATPRDFDFTDLLPEIGWTGDGYELANEGRIAEPRSAGAAVPASRRARLVHRPAPAEPGSADAAGSVAAAARRGVRAARAFSPLATDDPRRWQRGLLLHELRHFRPPANVLRPRVISWRNSAHGPRQKMSSAGPQRCWRSPSAGTCGPVCRGFVPRCR